MPPRSRNAGSAPPQQAAPEPQTRHARTTRAEPGSSGDDSTNGAGGPRKAKTAKGRAPAKIPQPEGASASASKAKMETARPGKAKPAKATSAKATSAEPKAEKAKSAKPKSAKPKSAKPKSSKPKSATAIPAAAKVKPGPFASKADAKTDAASSPTQTEADKRRTAPVDSQANRDDAGARTETGAGTPPRPEATPDFEALARNLSRIYEEGGKAFAAALDPMRAGHGQPELVEHAADAVRTIGKISEYWLRDPQRALDAQQALRDPLVDLWGRTFRRLSGEPADSAGDPGPADKRFADPEWRENPLYDFLRQAYGIVSSWADAMVRDADAIDPLTREKAQFYLRQITGALSPANFLATNPELLRETLREGGENLVRGLKMLAEDIEAGGGKLKIRQSDSSRFKLGENMATTAGKVVFRNELMELIQYAPTTERQFRRPLLIVPPWINKFYVLDLNPEKSFVRYCLDNGLTVFLISWVNPDKRHADKSFDAYMHEGVLTALDAIEAATGERETTAIGYCVGGTLLAITLAYMAATGDKRISSATLFTTQVDFTDAGDLKLFVDAARIEALEERMRETGYLEGANMAAAFNMLRPNELIWSFFVNNYLKGKEPMPFDLLTWNSDSTRMPAANHSFYLRNCYLDNTLTRGKLEIDGVPLDLNKVTIPIYNLAAKEDHIAPARSVFNGAKFFGGEMRYVLAGSGHIAGVINPPSRPKYQYWTGAAPEGDFKDWVAAAQEHPGSWWPDWIAWIKAQAPEQVPARNPGEGKLEPICDAPGEYVRVKA